tara:strand:+ start:125 stop:523 length:399 start_codon:yes stop_codon:yes gene_type:complete
MAIINPAMTAGIGNLLRNMFAAQEGNRFRDTQNIAFDPRFREVDLLEMLGLKEDADMAAPLIPVEVQELEKADAGKPNILLDKEGRPVRRDEDRMESEFVNPFIMIPGLDADQQGTPDLDIRDLLNMLFNRG